MSQPKVRIKREAVLRLLTRRNMSQNKLGEKADLTSGHVSQLLNGKRNVSPKTRARIQSVLGVSFDEIFEARFCKR